MMRLLLTLLWFSFTDAQTNVYCNVQDSSGTSRTNRGLSYGYYDTNPYMNTANGNVAPAQRYPAYDPTFVNTIAPIYIGQTTFIGFAANSDGQSRIKIYPDSPTHAIANVSLVHRGFLYARTSGTYTFTASTVDEIVLTWLNGTAYSGYTRANAVEELATSSTETPISYALSLTAGQYLPLRIQYSNAQGASAFTYSITNPAGTVLLDRTTSVDIVSQPCDGSAQFPDFYGGNPNCQGDSALSTDGSGNKGLQYGIWNSTTRNQDASFSTYPVGAFDATAAVHLGVTNRIGFNVNAGPGDSGQVVPIYSDTTQRYNSAFITIIHRGYLYARTSGSYSFSVSAGDDIVLVWAGNNAVSGFTRANANLVFVTSSNPQTQIYTMYLYAGQYVPLRIQWNNAQGGAGFTMTVADGAGQQLLNSTATTDFYYQTCPGQLSNGNAIPQFARFFTNSTTYTTITSAAADETETQTATSTIAIPSGTVQGTVEVIIPRSYITISTTDPIATAKATSTLAVPSGANPGTVQVIFPRIYTTITSTAADRTVTGTATITLVEPSGSTPGTVEVVVPRTYITITGPNTFSEIIATDIFTTVIAEPSGTIPGTIEVVTPASYVTTTITYTGPGSISQTLTSTIAQASGTTPGTVAIYKPEMTGMTSITRPATITTAIASNSCYCTPASFF